MNLLTYEPLDRITQGIEANRLEASLLTAPATQEQRERLNLLNSQLFELETARAELAGEPLAPYRFR